MNFVCILYVSEGVKNSTICHLKSIATNSSVLLGSIFAHSFQDQIYNRTSFYFLGGKLPVLQCALRLCSEAFNVIDFRDHSGSHPTLGVVDHVCFSKVGLKGMSDEADTNNIAIEFAREISNQENVPVYTYGWASPRARVLADIRKDLGYFTVTSSADVTPISHSNKLRLIYDSGKYSAPDFYVQSQDSHQDSLIYNDKKGIICVGGVPLVLNFNIRYSTNYSKSLIIQITKHIRVPQIVEAMTLHHGDTYEVACNLRNTSLVGPEIVLARATEKSEELGLKIHSSYVTGPTEAELIALLPQYEGTKNII